MEQQAGKFNRASTVGVSSYHSIHFSSQSDYGHLLEACIACKQSITAPHTDTIHRELKIKCEAFLITDVSQFLTTPSQFTTSRQPITSLGIHDKQTGIGWFPHCCPPRLPGWLSTHAARLVVSYQARLVDNAHYFLQSHGIIITLCKTLLAARRHDAAKVPDSKVKQCLFTLLLGKPCLSLKGFGT